MVASLGLTELVYALMQVFVTCFLLLLGGGDGGNRSRESRSSYNDWRDADAYEDEPRSSRRNRSANGSIGYR